MTTLLKKDYQYSSVLWEEIMQRVQEIIRDEYNISPYVAPTLNRKTPSPFRIWSSTQGTETLYGGAWHKKYTISVNHYLKTEDSERFYRKVHEEAERLYQLFFNNQGTKSTEILGFFGGEPEGIQITQEGDYFRIEVLFTCQVFRADDVVYVVTAPSSIRARTRAIEPVLNFWSLDFDGTDDYINTGLYNLTAPFAISIWFQADGMTSGVYRTLFSHSSDLRIYTINKTLYESGTETSYLFSASSTSGWQHLVLVDDDSNRSMYLNGSVILSNYKTSSDSTAQSVGVFIGEWSATSRPMKGRLSEVSVFSSALSSSEIETMYNNGQPILLTENQGSYKSSGDLVAYYRMGSGSGDDRATYGLIADQVDSSVGTNELSDYSMATDTWKESHFTYDATNDGYRFDDDTTGYIKTTPTGGSDTISLSPGVYKIQFTLLDGGTANGNCSLLFRVREPDATTHTLISKTTYLSSPSGTTYTRYFYIPETSDELEIYAYDPQSHDFLIKDILLYKIGGNSGIMENFDSLDFRTNVPQIYDKALFSNSLVFDGTDEYISISDSDTFSFNDNGTNDSAFSVSAWVNMVDAIDFDIINKDDEVSNREWWFRTKSTGELIFNMYDNDETLAYIGRKTASIQSYEGSWIHVVGTYNGDGESSDIKIYINGSVADNADNENNTSDYTAMHNTSIGLEIGRDSSKGTPRHCEGNIADIAVFNSTLDATNVTAMYNSGKPIDLTCDAGNYNNANNMVGYWKMGDGYLDELPSANNNGGIIDQVTPVIDDDIVGGVDFNGGDWWVSNPSSYPAEILSSNTFKPTATYGNISLPNSRIPANESYIFHITGNVNSTSGKLGFDAWGGQESWGVGWIENGDFDVTFLVHTAYGGIQLQTADEVGFVITINTLTAQKVEGNPGACINMNASSQSISVPE